MEWYVVLTAMSLLLIGLIAIGLPIPFALAAASLPFLWGIQSFATSLVSVQLIMWKVWADYVLLTIPLFVFVGELIGRSAIGPRLYEFMHGAVHVRGSAVHGTIGASAGFGAVCGSSMVGALTIGRVALPQMIRLGYSRRLAAGSVAAGGTLSVLIPPSLILIFYGVVTNVSIGKLFIAGVIPGVVLAFLFIFVAALWLLVRPADAPKRDDLQLFTFIRSLVALGPVVVIGGIIFGGIYFGITTPTEAAAASAVATILIAFTVGKLTLRGFIDAATSTLMTMGFVGILLVAAGLFGFVLVYYEVPQGLSQWLVTLNLSPMALLVIVIIFYLGIGTLLDPISIVVITVPILFPLIVSAGYNPLWFGIILVILMEIAALTPPVGLNLYVLQGLDPEGKLKVTDVFLGCIPFIGALLVMIALVFWFPSLALWLPSQI